MVSHEALISKYNMVRHPEGGYYAQTYISHEMIPVNGLPERFTGARPFSTAIYFLLVKGNFSAFHRLKSDECWHFYSGQPLLVYEISIEGKLSVIRLGNDVLQGEIFQYVVPAGAWFASEPAPGSAFSFVGCTVAPGFDFADFELAQANELAAVYPQHEAVICRLCRQ